MRSMTAPKLPVFASAEVRLQLPRGPGISPATLPSRISDSRRSAAQILKSVTCRVGAGGRAGMRQASPIKIPNQGGIDSMVTWNL